MSLVFLALEIALDRRVVIKVLPPEMAAALSVERFKQEIRLAAQLQHPHIVPLLSAGEVNGLPYFTMPYVEGESLRTQIAQRGESPAADAMRILREVASALDYAHSQGIVHRDIKPDNVLLSHGSAMLTDLGVAKALNASATRDGRTLTGLGMTLGTPAYMAPEQAAADPDIDHRADIYAWGVMAYEMLSGTTPFSGRTPQAMLAAHVTEAPESLGRRRPGVPPALTTLVMRCLEKRKADRPQSAATLVQSLDAVVTPDPTSLSHVPMSGGAMSSARPTRHWVVAAVVVVAAALGAYAWTQRAPVVATAPALTSDRRTIAVMPFVAVGNDSAQGYISDGMTDELAAALAKVPGLQVAARRSAFSFKGKNADPATIGKALNVGLLLDGTVRRDKDRVRVNAQLTNVTDRIVLWSDRYEGDAKDIFAVQDSIAAAIVGALRLKLGAGTRVELATTRTKDPAAHDLYLKGKFEASKHTREGLLAGIDLFQRSTTLDPSYPLPWVGLADAYGWLADAYMPPREAYGKAKVAVARAIALAPTLSEAYAVLGWINYAYEWDSPASEKASRTAVELDSSSALARSNHSYALQALGRHAEALAESRKALELEPLSAAYSSNLEWHLLMQRQYAAVVAQHAQTMKIDPTYFFGDSWAGSAHRELGQYAQSIAEFRQAQAINGNQPMPGLVATYARMGDMVSARRELARLLDFSKRTHVPSERIAQAYIAVGETERSWQWLDRAFDERSNGLLWLHASALYDPLRKDPRFDALVKRIVSSRP
jgi:TolB-like protein/tRNA A-37 threonylcarbamoyl transferase component Bud32/tetratricopeptide (TPR) repeat protein